jgi:hypothetical protein
MPSQDKKSCGFFTIAQNTEDTDYVRLAYGLALSLRHTQAEISNLSIGVTPGTVVPAQYAWAFDQIVEIPWGDDAELSQWKLENEWKSVWMSPYDETIKLDADMLFFSDIAEWWEYLINQPHDVIWANRVLDWKADQVTSDHYRKTFTNSGLPNVYSAFGYFRKTKISYDFFHLCRYIYWNWAIFFERFLAVDDRPDHPSTDVIFALAAKIFDIDDGQYQNRSIPVFTHMKSHLQGWNLLDLSDDWTKTAKVFFDDNANCKIANHRQIYPLHYHVKSFLTDEIIKKYERLVKKDGIHGA